MGVRRRGGPALAVALCALSLTAVTALAAAGRLDSTFAGDGKRLIGFANGPGDDEAFAVAIQPDGMILVAGHSVQSGAGLNLAVARLRPSGSPDPSFSGDGRAATGFGNGARDDFGSGIAIQSDARIVVVGQSEQPGGNRDFGLARYLPNGKLDRTFSGDGRRLIGFANGTGQDHPGDVAIQPDGRILVAGFSEQAGIDKFAVARLRPNGRLDPSFSGDGRRLTGFGDGSGGHNGLGSDVAIQDDGRILVSGYSFQAGTGPDFAIARFRSNGRLDTSFSGDGRRLVSFGGAPSSDFCEGLAIQPDGRILVVGESVQAGTGFEIALARLMPGGGLDTSFSGDGRRLTGFASGGGGHDDFGTGLAIQRDGRIVVGGRSEQSSGHDFAVIRYRKDGSLDTSFSGDGKRVTSFGPGGDYGLGIAIQPDGRIVQVGYSEQGSRGKDFAVARYLAG